MGRSGNLTESQPKALGSSILANLANSLALDAIRHIGTICERRDPITMLDFRQFKLNLHLQFAGMVKSTL